MRRISKLVFVAAAAVASAVVAADKTWTGGSDTAWAASGNWSPVNAPISSSFVIIPGSLTNYPELSASNSTIAGLEMDAGSQLTVSSGKTLTITSNASRNALNGTITVTGANSILTLDTAQSAWTNGGTLVFASGGNFYATNDTYAGALTLTNTSAGIIRADAGSTALTAFATVSGGTLDGAWWARSTTGSAWHGGVWSPHWLSMTNVTLGTNFSAVSASTDTYPSTHIGPANLFLTGSVTNNSTAFNYPSYGSMALEPATATSTFTFNGTGSLGLQGQTLAGTGVSTIANNGTHTLKGYGSISATNLTNAGTVWATGGTAGTPRTLSATGLASTGSIAVDQYSTLAVSGTLLSDTGSTVTMSGGTISAGTFTLRGGLSGYGTIGNVANSGSILARGGSAGNIKTLYTGTITGAGTVTVDQYNALSATGTVAASTVQVNGELHTDNSNWNVSSLNDTGTVHVETGKSLTSTGAVTSAAGSILMVNGTLTAPSVSMAGALSGSGTINSIVTLTGTGVVSPGNSPGTLVLGNLTISDGAVYDYEVGDSLSVTGTLDFTSGGALTLLVPASIPTGTYTFMNAGTVIGTPRFQLSGATGSFFNDGHSFSMQIPEPGMLSVVGASSLLMLRRRRIR